MQKTTGIFHPDNHNCEKLWKAARKGDRKAFEMLYNKTVIPLSDYAFRLLGDEHAVKDLLQDLFVDIYLRKEEINEDVNIAGYLLNAVKYKVANILRSRTVIQLRSVPIEAVDNALSAKPDEAEIKEKHAELENNIQTLPQKCREAFILNYVDDLSYKDIASEMNISVKTVEKHISKALKVLRNSRWAN